MAAVILIYNITYSSLVNWNRFQIKMKNQIQNSIQYIYIRSTAYLRRPPIGMVGYHSEMLLCSFYIQILILLGTKVSVLYSNMFNVFIEKLLCELKPETWNIVQFNSIQFRGTRKHSIYP